MSRELFVANLSSSVEKNEVERLFAAHGVVRSVEVIDELKSFESTGTAFVQMDSEEHAEAAITAFNGFWHQGLALIVGWVPTRHSAMPHIIPLSFEPTNIPPDDEVQVPR